MTSPIFVIDIDPAGIVASHPRRVELPVLVAPIPDEQKATHLNTVRPKLVTIGCMRLFRDGFAFDSSVVSPQSEVSFTKFAKLMQSLRGQDDMEPKRFPPCAVFGHADPTGKDPYNKTLSGRRALAVYAVLCRKVDIWEDLYSGYGGDEWGLKAIQTMLSISLHRTPNTEPDPPFYTGPIDGKRTEETNAAVSAYLESREFGGGTRLDRPQDANRRAVLFQDYMDAICHDPDGQPFVLDANTDFIGQQKDKNLKADVQGCGELNPLFLFSQDEEKDFAKDPLLAKAVRDPLYVVNRRVVVYAFVHGTVIDPDVWPCPHAHEDSKKCTSRLWSDHSKRRNAGPVRREFGENMTILDVDETGVLTEQPVENSGNTMGCRFYHAFARYSPCEAKLREWVVRFKVDDFGGKQTPVSNRRYVVEVGETAYAAVIRGRTDEKGEVRIPVFDEHTTITLKLDVYGKPKTPGEDTENQPPTENANSDQKSGEGFDTDRFPDEDHFTIFKFDAGALKPREADDDFAIKQRLFNLGFGLNAPASWDQSEFDQALHSYRRRRGMDEADDAAVREKILSEHDLEDPTPSDDDSPPPDHANIS